MRYTRPAVHIERVDAARQGPIVLRTDVAAFVGIARRGPIDTPVVIESFRQFVAHFGEFTPAGYLAYAVRGFFENGGLRCWVVRVASTDRAGGARAAAVTVSDVSSRPALRVAASSAGTWGSSLSLEWAPESGATAISMPASSSPHFATVDSTAGFEPGLLVRVEESGASPVHRVVAEVDGARRRLYWVHPEPGRGLPTDRALDGVTPTERLRITRVAYSLTVREEGRVARVYRDLHLVPSHPRHIARVLPLPDHRPAWLAFDARFAPQALDAPEYDAYWAEPAPTEHAKLPRPAEPIAVATLRADARAIPLPLSFVPGEPMALGGGRDGLSSLAIDDLIGEPVAAADSDFVKRRKTRGIEALVDIEEVALVAVPDALIRPEPYPVYLPAPSPRRDPCVLCPAPEPRARLRARTPVGETPPGFSHADIARLQAALLRGSEALDRFAVLSLPFDLATDSAQSSAQIIAWRRQFDSRNGALYSPWLDVAEPRANGGSRRVPACGHVTGSIARTDVASGVQRAPGNVSIRGGADLSRSFGDEAHGELNAAHVNVLRGEFGQAPKVGGARSLSFDPEWRFLSVVRLVTTIERAARIALRWVVFEPNTPVTRAAVATTLTALLDLFFERGAFRGPTRAESYFVRCDDVTTPPEERENGRLLAHIGIAPVAPSEFVVLRVGREHDAILTTIFGESEARRA